MNKKRLGIIIALLTVFFINVKGQNPSSLRINEVLIVNTQNYQDHYGDRNAWIEIFNTSYGSIDLKGCYLTNDKNNPTKYSIPKCDAKTRIKPRQHSLFWADNNPSRGTFHVNFKLDPEKDNYIALYDSDGKTLIDEVVVPKGIPADHSYARVKDGGKEWSIKGEGYKGYVTPDTNNQTIDNNDKIEKFRKEDSIGVGMAITAMSVVFFGLLVLFIIFKLVGNAAMAMSRRNAMKAAGISNEEEAIKKNIGNGSGEEAAAISMAIHEYLNDAHDFEDMILTINRVKRNYSPWSSKIYTLRQNPKR